MSTSCHKTRNFIQIYSADGSGSNIDLSETDGQDNTTMLEFWKKFNIMKAIEIISESQDEVKPSCMNGVWHKTWHECVDRTCAAENDDVPAVCHEITNLARESNFEGMEEPDINEFLTSHKNLTTQQISSDPDSEKSIKVSLAVATNINCYKEIYFTLKKQVKKQQSVKPDYAYPFPSQFNYT